MEEFLHKMAILRTSSGFGLLIVKGCLTSNSILDSESGEEMREKKSVDVYCFASVLIVLSDSEVRFGKINMTRIGSVDFQPFLTNLGQLRKFNFSTPASYLAPILSREVTGL